MKNVRYAIVAMVLVAVASQSYAAVVNSSDAMFDYTSLPGYGVASSSTLSFSNDGWGGWSAPTGKVVLGAEVTALGGYALSVSAPALPGTAYPHYTYGADEYGWVVKNGGTAQDVTIDIFYADAPTDYTITKSSQLNYNGSGGWGGWSAPTGHVVTGGGYEFLTNGATPAVSEIGTPGSVWPHYTFGAEEAGWVVQDGGVSGGAHVYVVSFVPEPASLALLGLGGLALVARRRR